MMLYLRRHFDSLAEAQAWKLPSNISFCMAAKTTYQQKKIVCERARAECAFAQCIDIGSESATMCGY